MNPLLCPVCGFANEDNRVFCQNCGARLPVSNVENKADPASPQAKATSPRSGPRRLLPRHTNSLPGRKSQLLASAASVVTSSAITGFLLAILLQILRPPDGLPPRVTRPSETFAAGLATSLHTASENFYPRTVEVSTEQANNFLAARVRLKRNSAAVKFVRCYAIPQHGATRIGIEQALLRLPIYIELLVQPQMAVGKLEPRFIGGSIGRMPIPSPIVSMLVRSFNPIFQSVDGLILWLSSASLIESSPKGWTIHWPGARAHR